LNAGRDQSTLSRVYDIDDPAQIAQVEDRRTQETPECLPPVRNDF
jgi:hypothetical protein